MNRCQDALRAMLVFFACQQVWAAQECTEYQHKSCAYFTRPSIESEDGVTRTNYYADGATVCYQGCQWKCEQRHWISEGECKQTFGWEKRQAEYIEQKRAPSKSPAQGEVQLERSESLQSTEGSQPGAESRSGPSIRTHRRPH